MNALPKEGGRPTAQVHAPRHHEPTTRPPISIIIPVFNAADELQLCLRSLQRNTTRAARLVLIDDASTDPAVEPLLDQAAELEHVETLRNRQNQGFTATVNRGIRACGGDDVVILNSDTVVTPRWLERLSVTAYMDPLLATVTPVSDNAGAFSVPRIGVANPVPAGLDYDQTSRALAQQGPPTRPRTPTGSGFCLYIKRAVLDEVGLLDEKAFPRGYGEENDFCMRALSLGWHHVVDDSVFVHHVREASFGSEKHALMETGRATVNRRHPQYTALVREFVNSEDLTKVRDAVQRTYDALASRGRDRRRWVRPRLLSVVHEGRGGTTATNLDLLQELEDEYDCLLLSSTGKQLMLDRIVEGRRVALDRHQLEAPVLARDFSRQDYRKAVQSILDGYAIELVHVRHLFKHTFDLPPMASRLGLPIVFSFHDFYFTCPTVHLLDEQLHYCGGVCTEGEGPCQVPGDAIGELPPLKHRFVHQWREEVEHMLAGVDAFVTSSAAARDVHLSTLPTLRKRPFELIEHGRELAARQVAVPPRPGGEVRIAVPGNLDRHKGGEFMRTILEQDRTGRIRFQLMGEIPAKYRDLGESSGPYQREELTQRLASARPAFVGLFSIWPETYDHTLSEAWAAGVPVIGTALGAIKERIEAHGGGWLIDPADPRAAAERILGIADDPAAYSQELGRARGSNVRTLGEMAADYRELFERVTAGRRVFLPRAAGD